ncbi:hypothetical protein CU097_012769 [Rhizopus azygosporus]|uniref:Inositol polyphosphate-related phosphatase domain-containing protein n=1 Tax=Rhizopus azygosporus TaxID=86630 RepID=A0A367JTH5_RHIAZ|nr:hypothetical protein CU097_012769 [Rhizopus azygosporus]
MEEEQKSFKELKNKWAQIEGEHAPPPIPPKPTYFSLNSTNNNNVAIPIADEHKKDVLVTAKPADNDKTSLSPPKYDPFSESSEDYDDEDDEDDEEDEIGTNVEDEVDDSLIEQVQKTHLHYTKLEESRSPSVHAQVMNDKKLKKPPPPPPPSKKYHSSLRTVSNPPNQTPSSPQTLVQPSISMISFNNKPETIAPPILPPRPAIPQLPPRPSQSTLARAHTIVSQQQSPPQQQSILSSEPEQQDIPDEKMNLRRANTVAAKRAMSRSELLMTTSIYPDFSQATRNPPFFIDQDHKLFSTMHKGSLTAIIAARNLIVTGAHLLKVWDLYTGTPLNIMSDISHHNAGNNSTNNNNNENGDKVRAMVVAPSISPTDQGRYIWMARQDSGLSVLDIRLGKVLSRRNDVHQSSITFLMRYRNCEIWSIDEAGILNVWDLTANEHPENPLITAMPRRHLVAPHATSCTIDGSRLWMSTGRTLSYYVISSSSQHEASPSIRIPNDLGNITKLITVPYHPGQLFASHDDGKISVWDTETMERKQVITVSLYGICTMACVGEYHIWAGYNTGMIYVYDTRPEKWAVVKMWKAHSGAVTQLVVDESGLIIDGKKGRLQVVSGDSNGYIGVWDGLLTEHWKECQILTRSNEYCTYDEAKIMICSWNIDANKPEKLTKEDNNEVRKWLGGMEDPDIIVVGIQEIVDLESKKQTARSLFFKKKVEEAEEVLTHRYKLWHDYLVRVIGENYGAHAYTVIKTEHMVGLFSCIFVRTVDIDRVINVESTCVKTGLKVMNKSIHGNKGGVAIRFVYDHSSLCFVNCHLAAGQSHVQQRNADAEGILQTATFQPRDYVDVFSHGGDGSLILDHEFCFLSGDLNYRIKMNRNDVLRLLASTDKEAAWEKLQLEDQLLKQKMNNPLFKLLQFEEALIQFDPTYKYDPGTDFYDRSEKKRVPAWCDRVLYKGKNIQNLYYRRHEAKASDHRPISAGFSVRTKVTDQKKRDVLSAKVEEEWIEYKTQYIQDKKARYVADYERCSLTDAFKYLENTNWDVTEAVRKVLT